MNLNLKTITDFDFGVGGSPNDCVRVSQVPDVKHCEVSLILWLMLEKEFSRATECFRRRPRTQHDGGNRNTSISDSDTANCSRSCFNAVVNQFGYGWRRQTNSKADGKLTAEAKTYAEALLRQVGVDLPFDELSPDERQALFLQFCASSELLRGEKFGSILDLYQALRSRSKFLEEFNVLQVLGRGYYGEVYSVHHKQSLEGTSHTENNHIIGSECSVGRRYAIKKISLTVEALEEIRMTLNESVILKKLRGHQNIVGFYDSWLEMNYDEQADEDEPLKFYLLMDHCGASLYEWKQRNLKEKIEEKVMLEIAQQVVDGLEFIHASEIIHLDLNPKNILWEDDQQRLIKIGDFGLAISGSTFEGQTGTMPYYAPENIMTRKSDIYSLGVTLFELSQNISTTSELITKMERKDIHTGFNFLDNILPILLDSNPDARPTANLLKATLNRLH